MRRLDAIYDSFPFLVVDNMSFDRRNEQGMLSTLTIMDCWLLESLSFTDKFFDKAESSSSMYTL